MKWLLFSVPTVLASVAGDQLGQYRTIGGGSPLCGSYIPTILCDISGVDTVSSFIGIFTNFVSGIVAAVAVCVFIYACICMIASQGQEDKLMAAKKMAAIALVGLFLAIVAIGIVKYAETFVRTATT